MSPRTRPEGGGSPAPQPSRQPLRRARRWPQHWPRCQQPRRHLPDSWRPWAAMDGGPLALTLTGSARRTLLRLRLHGSARQTPLTLTLTPVAHREGAGNCIMGMVARKGGANIMLWGGSKDLKCPTLSGAWGPKIGDIFSISPTPTRASLLRPPRCGRASHAGTSRAGGGRPTG
jgi:hypothetical protein